MSQEIKTPCSICGAEAETESGVHYVGYNFLDPEAKALCPAHFQEFEEGKKNRHIEFKPLEGSKYLLVCQECGMPTHNTFLESHAKLVHKCERFKVVE